MAVGVVRTTACQLQQLDVSTGGQVKVPTPIVSILFHHGPDVALDEVNGLFYYILHFGLGEFVRVSHQAFDQGFTGCKDVSVEAVLRHPVDVTRQV